MKHITNYWREIFDPSGSNISQLNRYIQEATLSGSLDMPVYENKLVN